MSWVSVTGLAYVSQGRAQIYGYCVLIWCMQRLNMEPENLPQMTIYQELEVLLTGAMRVVESLMMPGWRLYQVLIILA